MTSLWEISAGTEAGKIDISFITSRATKSAKIIIPALLLSNVALAADTAGKVGDTVQVTKKMVKARKQIKIFEKTAGLALAGKTCAKALEKGVQQHKSGNAGLDAALVAFAIACGYLIAITQLSLTCDD
uniref:Uncharacterized protein n=1 Tax=Thalassiosira tenera TaxID=291031 RepID=A0A8K1YH31_9STRA|nr:hypothetical protein LK045_pgp023 [Thalassiosira tenera]UBQ35248.1 hypothetical protein [Thalassiosira tenera]